MSEADKMFEELGYIEHFNTEHAECYRKDSSRSLGRQIAFNTLNKNVMIANYISQEELKAINQKCKELGWLDNASVRVLEYADNPITP